MKTIDVKVMYSDGQINFMIDGELKFSILVKRNPDEYFIKYAFEVQQEWQNLKDTEWLLWGKYIKNHGIKKTNH